LTPTRIELVLQAVQKPGILVATQKISAAAQQQTLLDGFLETVVPLLDVAILMGLGCLDLLAHHPVIVQQRLITPRELLRLREVVHGGTHPVRSMACRYPA